MGQLAELADRLASGPDGLNGDAVARRPHAEGSKTKASSGTPHKPSGAHAPPSYEGGGVCAHPSYEGVWAGDLLVELIQKGAEVNTQLRAALESPPVWAPRGTTGAMMLSGVDEQGLAAELVRVAERCRGLEAALLAQMARAETAESEMQRAASGSGSDIDRRDPRKQQQQQQQPSTGPVSPFAPPLNASFPASLTSPSIKVNALSAIPHIFRSPAHLSSSHSSSSS
jgi:hypothetical protein